jgi:hypothetical protein
MLPLNGSTLKHLSVHIFDDGPQVRLSEMRVSLRHRRRLLPEDCTNLDQRRAFLREKRRRRVSQIVKSHVHETRRLESGVPRLADVERRHAGLAGENKIAVVSSCLHATFHCGKRRAREGHPTALTVLGVI